MKDTNPTSKSRFARTALASPAILLLALQISSRLFTFALNQAMVRVSDPATYGTAHIKLELILSLLLTLSREAIRGASLRLPGHGLHRSGQIVPIEVRVLHLSPIVVGLLITVVVTLSLRLGSTFPQSHSFTSETVPYYLAAGALELLAEPLYLHALSPYGGQNLMLRVRAEGMAAISKGVVTLGSTLIARARHVGEIDQKTALACFALGQVAYGLTVFATFFISYTRMFGLKPTLTLFAPFQSAQDVRGIATSSRAEPSRRLVAVLFLQSFVKYLATEADKLAVSHLGSPQDQGGYALGVNYASLPLRMLFQPLEESARLHFSRHQGGQLGSQRLSSEEKSGSHSSQCCSGASQSDERQQRCSDINSPTSCAENVCRSPDGSLSTMTSLLRLHSILGLLIVCYLPPLSALIIELLSGSQWAATSAVRTLSAYAYLLPVSGYSGILEGFVQSTGGDVELQRYNKTIFASSAAFFCVLLLLSWIGPVSTEEHLVFASIVSMLVRAVAAWKFAKRVFGAESIPSLRSLLPRPETSLLAVTGGILARWAAVREASLSIPAESFLIGHMPLLCIAAATGLTCICSLFIFDRKTIVEIYDTVRNRV